MMNLKYSFLQITLLILFLSLPHSSPHDVNDRPSLTDNKCQCPCPCSSPDASPPISNNNNNNQSPPQPPDNNNNGQSPPQTPNNNSKDQSPPPTPNNNNRDQSPPQTPNNNINNKDQSPSQTPNNNNNNNNNNQSPPQPPNDNNNDKQSPPKTPDNNDNDNQSVPQTPNSNNKKKSPPQSPNDKNNDNQTLPQTPNNNNNQSPPDNSNPSSSPTQDKKYEGAFSKVYAFGDSFTDTGNAYLMGGLKSFVGSLISQVLQGTHSKLPGQRPSNGLLVVDFLCESLSIPYLPPFKSSSANFSAGVNFAIAGSTSLSVDFFNKPNFGNSLLWKGVPLNFQTQLDWFQTFTQDIACQGKDDNACKDEFAGALFWIGEMGGNDYARTFGSPLSKKMLSDLALESVQKLLKTLLDKGAKFIVVQGLPPIGCCPLELFLAKPSDRDQMGCASSGNTVIQAHNEQLQKMIAELQSHYSGCTIAYADYWGAFRTILSNHQKYQFEEPFKACCGVGVGPFNFNLNSLCGAIGTSACKDPARFIHWDGIHFTDAMNKVLAHLFLYEGFMKPTFSELIKLKMEMHVNH